MKYKILLLFLVFLYTCDDRKETPKKNVLLICIDDLRPELNSFGASYIKSPNIDSLVSDGVAFNQHFVNAPSCGPSRYTLLTGQYGFQYRKNGNNALFARAEKLKNTPQNGHPSMPEYFKKNGYTTTSVGKISHHPGGLGGKNWDDSTIIEMPNAWTNQIMPVGAWKHPRGAMHGLANGKIRTEEQREPIEAFDGDDTSYPDGLIAEEGIKQLELLAKNKEPFFLAIGLIKPHLPFGMPKKYLDLYEGVNIPAIQHPEKPERKTTWHPSGEFMSYHHTADPREDSEYAMQLKRYYAACVSYADKHVGDILKKLKETGADKNTIVVLWGDHGWHLGEHAIWGKHSLFEESLHSPLVVFDPSMKTDGDKIDTIVETVDIFPTLSELCQLPKPDFVNGHSLLPLMKGEFLEFQSAISYTSNATTIRTTDYRFIQHKDGTVELYNHKTDGSETMDISNENPEIVNELKQLLSDKMKSEAFNRNL